MRNAFIIFLIAVVGAGCGFDPMNMRRHLPNSATDIHEELFESGVDYARYMKAKVTKDEYLLFAKKIGYKNVIDASSLASLSAGNLHPNWKWEEKVKYDWWLIKGDALLGSYYNADTKTESYSLLQYYDGYIYFKFMKL